jgi:hypothetical protein
MVMNDMMRSLPPIACRFFSPSDEFVRWAVERAGESIVYDVGAGEGHVTAMLAASGVKALALDLRENTAIADYELGRTLALTDPSADRTTARTALNRALVLQRQLDAQNPEYAEYRLFLTKIFRELSRLPGDNGYAAHEADTLAAELSARDPQRWEYQGL